MKPGGAHDRRHYRGRFAPSPTGDLHFGSLIAAIGSWLRARSAGGTWLVRMEDLDPPREVPGSAARILATLDAYGLHADEPVELQSRRAALYDAALAQLEAAGHAFECWCSRAELGPGRLHVGPCARAPDPSRPPAWRVRVPADVVAFVDRLQGPQRQRLDTEVGDFVVRRVEGWAAYQLAVVVDDAQQRISEVVRGADLLDSTPRQILLQRLLGVPTPDYVHLPLAVAPDGTKLSKQLRSTPVDPSEPLPALRRALAFLGVAPSHAATADALLADAVRTFDLGAVPRTPAIAIEDVGAA